MRPAKTKDVSTLEALVARGDGISWHENQNPDHAAKMAKETLAEPGQNIGEILLRGRIPKRLLSPVMLSIQTGLDIEDIKAQADNKYQTSVSFGQTKLHELPASLRGVVLLAETTAGLDGEARIETAGALTFGAFVKAAGNAGKKMAGMMRASREKLST
jgi:hypothetical protein